jgi:hypothetical protein
MNISKISVIFIGLILFVIGLYWDQKVINEFNAEIYPNSGCVIPTLPMLVVLVGLILIASALSEMKKE